VIVIAMVFGLAALATAGHELLPRLFLDGVRTDQTLNSVFGGLLISLNALALALLWRRRASVLDLWLMVMCCAWLIETVIVAILNTGRFTISFYAGRTYALIATIFVLIVLLSETTKLYARLARSTLRQRREREGRHISMDLMTASIAHEVNQPLGAIVANGNAVLRLLAMETPDLGEARTAAKSIVSDGHRAGEVIECTRAIFRKTGRERTSLEVNAIIRDVLVLMVGDLGEHGVVVQTALDDNLPAVTGNRGQLQQVFLNLIMNALEAMTSVTSRRRVLQVRSEFKELDGVLVSVEDSGTGIAPKDLSSIFDSFFTTKSQGTGIGLSICRSIIEAHQGQIWVTAGAHHGAVFNILLPTVGPGTAQ
jgi:signal transduction histidine kinase